MCSPVFGLAGMAASGRKLNPLAAISPAAALASGGIFKKKKPTDQPGGMSTAGSAANGYGG